MRVVERKMKMKMSPRNRFRDSWDLRLLERQIACESMLLRLDDDVGGSAGESISIDRREARTRGRGAARQCFLRSGFARRLRGDWRRLAVIVLLNRAKRSVVVVV